ncbi:helix-turn-helix transcriptional regulator [Planosporangium thailandense]|uniref:Helix-turn-helix transcriptional regulator n=1 Tax=Planosporangium thailandense TaxID=765197 RepID=A0ABX0Y4R2_9ACTN|nr:metalloregulator ArsR/SmtB family transcription factor [Planosporangium thailandense]NJC72398.1 helix-turn-helix transcriptional regulator [Planosporangium thailandense]
MAQLAGLLADGTRATFCLALLDGRAWTAGELARLAGVAPSTASAHLTHLVGGGLLAEERQGRHRYVRLADPGVAELIEDLAAYSPRVPVRPNSLRTANATAALAWARTCYDHLAGRLGVLLVDAMTDQGLLEAGWGLSDHGLRWFADLGIDVAALRSPRRPLVRHCLDWTERRPHLAGAAGAALCRHFFDRGWVTRAGGQRRAVRVTESGRAALHDVLGVPVADLTPPTRSAGRGGRA